jgi:hypothetical protein
VALGGCSWDRERVTDLRYNETLIID